MADDVTTTAVVGDAAQAPEPEQAPEQQQQSQQPPAPASEPVQPELPFDWPKLVESLPENLREEAKRATNLSGIVERVIDLRKALSKAREGYVPAPRPDMTDAERAALHKALGVPEKPEQYALALPEDMLPDEGAKARLGRFAAAMHEAGAPAKVAEAAVAFHVAETRAAAEAEAARLAEIVRSTEAELKATWGGDYDRLRGVAKSAAVWAFGETGFAALEASGALADATVVKGLAKIGAQLGESLPDFGPTRENRISAWEQIVEEGKQRQLAGTYNDPAFQRRLVEAAQRAFPD